MDTLILFALIACAMIGFVFGAAAGAAVMHDHMDMPTDPEDDQYEDW